jgi:hypothetical protein
VPPRGAGKREPEPSLFLFRKATDRGDAATPATVGEVGIWSSTDETRGVSWGFRASDENASMGKEKEKEKEKKDARRSFRFSSRTIRR